MIWTDCYKELVEIIRSKDEFLASIPDEYSELRDGWKIHRGLNI